MSIINLKFSPKLYCVVKNVNYSVEKCQRETVDDRIIYRTPIKIKAQGICNYMNNATNPLLSTALKNWKLWV